MTQQMGLGHSVPDEYNFPPHTSLVFRDSQLERPAGDLTEWNQAAFLGGWLLELCASFCQKMDSER